MTKKSIKKLITLFAAALIVVISAFTFTGCSYEVDYTLITDADGNKHYTVSLAGYSSGLKGEYEIPEYFGEGDTYAPVTEIAAAGFSNTRITKITIPKTVTTIGASAFVYCSVLEEVVFAEGSTLTTIPHGIFGNCSNLAKINIPDTVERISGYAFYYCSALKELEMPSSLKSIAMFAFNFCTALESVTFPDTLTTIGDLAFYNCTSLTEIVIPDSVHDTTAVYTSGENVGKEYIIDGLGYGTFHTCTALKTVVIGAGVSNLKSGVFGYCTALETVYLPLGLKKIEGVVYNNSGEIYLGHAFHNDGAIAAVHYAGTQEEWNLVEVDNETVLDSYGNSYDNSAIVNAPKTFSSVFAK